MTELGPAIELFCGIGGFSVAAGGLVRPGLAVDVDQRALSVHALNFPHHARRVGLIESVPTRRLAEGSLWWASPPCQPFTRRGRQRDLDDPRAAAIPVLAERIALLRPRHLLLENVPGFAGSRAHALVRQQLDRAGYHVVEELLCSSELGLPARRPRWYLVASRAPLREIPSSAEPRQPLAAFLEADDDPTLLVPPATVERFHQAMRIVARTDPEAVAPTFTSGYATSPVQAGGFLATADGPRRFSPAEILRLLGFPETFRLPPELPRAAAWRLVGNSLAVPAVRRQLARLAPSGDADRV